MKKIVKYLIIFFISIIVIGFIIYIDYFNAKANNTNPKISIKVESDNYILYKAALYRVYYCKTNKKYIIADYNEEVVCPNNYEYQDGFYINREEVQISKKDLQLLTNDGVYTSEMIENFKTEKDVQNAVLVANSFGSKKFKVINEMEEYSIVIFPSFESVNDNYDWIYNEDGIKYCIKGENYNYQVTKYENDKCGKFEKIKMNDEWCENYKTSTLIYIKGIENLCK